MSDPPLPQSASLVRARDANWGSRRGSRLLGRSGMCLRRHPSGRDRQQATTREAKPQLPRPKPTGPQAE
eukprot:15443050-Alexandrium_andersonii.AAC.1